MNLLEIPFLDHLLIHLETFFKVPVSIQSNKLITSSTDAKIFFDFFTKNNIKLDIKVCQSLQSLFEFNDFKIYFQRKNRVIIILHGNTLFVHGNKTYAEMAHNHLLPYVNWDNLCTHKIFNEEEQDELKIFCEKENIRLIESFSIKCKKLLLNILEKCDGIEVVNFTKERCIKNNEFNNIIDLSMDDDEDSQIIDLTDVYERQVIMNSKDRKESSNGLRPVIIDGSNVAFSHGCGDFNPKGVHIAVNYFIERGHDHVYVLVPRHRQVEGGNIFEKLEKSKHLIYTPSRIINNKRETSYDDKLILEAAFGHGGVVISNDQYRDLLHIQKFKDIIINRLIPYTFVGDLFMIPDDPKGQLGPDLKTILSINNSSEINLQTTSTFKCSNVSSTKKFNNLLKNIKQKKLKRNHLKSVRNFKRKK